MVQLMGNWCHVFRALRYRLKFRRNLTTILPLTELARFDLQMVAFLFALNFGISPERLLKILRDKEVINKWEAIIGKANKEVAKYRGLYDIFALLAVLWKAIEEQNDSISTESDNSSSSNNNNEGRDRMDSGFGSSSSYYGDYPDDTYNYGRYERSYDEFDRDFSSPMLSSISPTGMEQRVEKEEKLERSELLKRGSYFLRDVLSYFLHDKHYKDYSRGELRMFIESVKVFVSFSLKIVKITKCNPL